ncbi:MAG: hypothetical protein KA059_04830 [Elusimicrobiales bacterium]|nr:hypothetical protein [Elusimicrobiales bacterium]NLH39732.1 hypothetical protein [Elusimicrobiota bacterium]
MEIITYEPVKVKIGDNFTWEEFVRSYSELLRNLERIFGSEPRSTEQKQSGYICRINPERMKDISNWPSKIRSNFNLSQNEIILLPNLKIGIILDSTVPNDEVYWEIHVEGVL